MRKHLEQDWIDEVRARNDLVDVISQYVRLKPSGKGFLGLCPFHSEKTPSFHVHSEKQFYHCFGCGEGGNVISFIMAAERLSFMEAVKFLAERVGMSLQLTDAGGKDTNASEIRERQLKDRILKANREAAKFYHMNLLSHSGRKAFDYLALRGIDAKAIKAFGLGYAPGGWENLKDVLLKEGFEEKFLLETGLLAESNNKTYDRFRNRIIFPIIDANGAIVGFGGRATDDSNPKYLNSSESLVFNKGKVLYGLNRITKQRPLESIILAEGYMDVIAMRQYGFENAVASLGTSLTVDQAKLLRRCAKQILIAYDGDSAGRKATLKALEILKTIDCDAKAVVFPDTSDPDEALRTYGKDAFKSFLENSLNLIGYKIWQLSGEYDFDTKNGVMAYAKRACELLKDEEDLIERDTQIKVVAQRTGLSVALVRQEVERRANAVSDTQKSVKGAGLGNNRYNGNRIIRSVSKQKALLPGHIKAERYLAGLMVSNDELAQRIAEKLGGHVFEEDINGQIFTIVCRMLKEGKNIGPAHILSRAEDNESRRRMAEIFDIEMEYDSIDKFITDCVAELSRYRERELRRERQEELIRMYREGSLDPDVYTSHLLDIDASNRRIKIKGQGDEGNI
jgi:DNA primase